MLFRLVFYLMKLKISLYLLIFIFLNSCSMDFKKEKVNAESNKQTEVVESLFYEYFIEGFDIGKHDELIRIAKLHDIYDNKTYNGL